MEERTRAYLRGRFGDHYRRVDLSPPPDAHEREWGYIPWTEGPGETMVRHKSLLDLGELESFLARERPRHVYFSAGRYADPSASSMAEKDWHGSDVVFDLDADHLPSVDPAETTYAEMLAACKDALMRLLDFLETDFGFEDLTIVFSGGRGYHVHVREEGIQQLDREGRREIVDYVRGIGLDLDGLVTTEMRGNVTARRLRTDGGWGKRVHEALLAFVSEIESLSEADAKDRLQELDGIGEGRATTVYGAIDANRDAIENGNLEAGGPGIRKLVDALTHEVITAQNAPIDEPVTTDTNRLIRLPGSLHGGSGLAVRTLQRDEIDSFDPLVDAIPDTFRGHEITVEVTAPGKVELDGDTFTLSEGVSTVPEYLGVFLMSRGRAQKGPE
ncbi:DNA primase small subunit PriS [Halorhabdus sp. CBA1104]|uniref:DNA primase small subunit PriS n=1 Tax=unclassified Halorhabdus TaxID=2621901 RepID=UPI0012B4120B|nr:MULTISPECIES: DNA primase small subunit PriS [unclassified Halorhabdus]QGN06708.1 DNA primase small subunit PriS [Halorhabdus sp. CBA1104]